MSAEYRVMYDRVGQRGGSNGSPPPPPLTVSADSLPELEELVVTDVRRYLRARFVEVDIDLETMRGQIICGFQSGGTFTIERTAEGGDRNG